MTGRGALLLVVLSASACPRRDAGAGAPASTSTTSSTSASTHTSARTATPPIGPLKAELKGIVLADGIGISVQASEAMELASSVQLIGEGADAGAVLTLRLDCRSQGCVSLAAGAELFAPSWIERPEGERCDALFRPARAGEYRLRVTSCDGTRQAETSVRWTEP